MRCPRASGVSAGSIGSLTQRPRTGLRSTTVCHRARSSSPLSAAVRHVTRGRTRSAPRGRRAPGDIRRAATSATTVPAVAAAAPATSSSR